MNDRANGANWELGLDEFGLDWVGDWKERDEINAINDYVNGLIPQVEADKIAGRITGSGYSKWLELKTDWGNWYQKVSGSWYFSEEDAAYARKKCDDIKNLLDPEGAAWVKATAHEKKIAATPKEYRKLMEEDQPWWQRHWKMLAFGTAFALGAVYLGTSAAAGVIVAKVMRH